MEDQISFLAVFCAFIFTPILVSLLLVKVNNEKLTPLQFIVILIIAMGVVIFAIVKIVNLISFYFGEIAVVLLLIILFVAMMSYNEKVAQYLKKIVIERDFSARLDIKSLATTLLALIGIPALLYLWANKFFIIDTEKMHKIFITEMAKVTQPLGEPNQRQTNHKFYSDDYLQYDYDNRNAQDFDTLKQHIKSQKQWRQWQSVEEDRKTLEYCNKEISLTIKQYQTTISAEMKWERGSYCHKNYGSPLVVPTTD